MRLPNRSHAPTRPNKEGWSLVYADEDFLALSGIQHYAFCKRQWALIHIDQAWADNVLTVQGTLMHDRAHDDEIRERRGNTLIVRNLYVRSPSLGIAGKCDVVEFRLSPAGHPLYGEQGLWSATPVEYKHGSSKVTNIDRLQLCAQAMCLEEVFASDIPLGYLYYGQTRSREKVELDNSLRDEVRAYVEEMHALFSRRYVPKVRPSASCRACSLNELCLPKVATRSVSDYIAESLEQP